MAKDELVGNLATENLLDYCIRQHEALKLDIPALTAAQGIAERIFI
jgi:hydroxymethylglutaryl-CoA lyase